MVKMVVEYRVGRHVRGGGLSVFFASSVGWTEKKLLSYFEGVRSGIRVFSEFYDVKSNSLTTFRAFSKIIFFRPEVNRKQRKMMIKFRPCSIDFPVKYILFRQWWANTLYNIITDFLFLVIFI